MAKKTIAKRVQPKTKSTTKSTTKTTARKVPVRIVKPKAASAKKVATKKAPAKKAKAPAMPPTPTLASHLTVKDGAAAIAWYTKALGAKEVARMPTPDGKIMHAHLTLRGATFFLTDLVAPDAVLVDFSKSGAAVMMNVYHKDCDKMWAGAVANGAKVLLPLDDQFWGQRYGQFTDPFGHTWALSWKSKLTQAQLEQKRAEAMAGYPKGA